MKIVTNELGRIYRSFITDEVRPTQGLNVHELLRLVNERYNFVIQPLANDAVTKGAVFQQGTIKLNGKTTNVLALGIFNNAITVNANDTDVAEQILDDFTEWMRKTIHTRDPITTPTTVYENHVIVEFSKSPDKALELFKNTGHALERAMQKTYKTKTSIGFARIGFGIDPTLHSSQIFKIPDLTIERRIGVSFSENRFYSLGPIRTKDHHNLLEEFENML